MGLTLQNLSVLGSKAKTHVREIMRLNFPAFDTTNSWSLY